LIIKTLSINQGLATVSQSKSACFRKLCSRNLSWLAQQGKAMQACLGDMIAKVSG